MKKDPSSPTFGLPDCLHVPIAASGTAAIEAYVGPIIQREIGRDGRVNALLVQGAPRENCTGTCAPLWRQADAARSEERLYPAQQVWVHVDFHGYRKAWLKFGLPLAANQVLDHIQNRKAMRLRGSPQPYLRLCPISGCVNTSGGINSGGEGMEKAYRQYLNSLSPAERAAAFPPTPACDIVYADPMDLTKMLDVAPGTQTLNGVRDTNGCSSRNRSAGICLVRWISRSFVMGSLNAYHHIHNAVTSAERVFREFQRRSGAITAKLALALAASSASVGATSSALAVGASSQPATVIAQAVPPTGAKIASARLDALRARYETLNAAVAEPRIIAPAAREELLVRLGSAAQTVAALAADPNEAVLADLERRADLDEAVVPQVLRGSGEPPSAAPGAHVGVAQAGSLPVPFAYWVPAGYDAHRAAALIVLLHGASQPESDLIARRFVRELADATGTVVLAPGGDDRDADAMLASLDAAQTALGAGLALDPRRRYIGGFSNGVFSAYHAVARDARGYAGFLGIAGFLRGDDARAVGRRLHGEGAYLVIGADDEVIGTAAVRASVRTLRGLGVFARYYEVAGAPHALRPLETTIARAWRDMLAGVTAIDNDGLGTVTESF